MSMLHNFPPIPNPWFKNFHGLTQKGRKKATPNFFILKSAEGVAELKIKMDGDNFPQLRNIKNF